MSDFESSETQNLIAALHDQRAQLDKVPVFKRPEVAARMFDTMTEILTTLDSRIRTLNARVDDARERIGAWS